MVYVALIKDRHADPSAEVFSDRGSAIRYTKKKADEYCRFPEDYEEKFHKGDENGMIFRVEYSCEGDNITVFEKDLIV